MRHRMTNRTADYKEDNIGSIFTSVLQWVNESDTHHRPMRAVLICEVETVVNKHQLEYDDGGGGGGLDWG